jgi:hypothetical protein
MCNQLAAISRAIGPDATEKLVLPEAGLSVQVKSSWTIAWYRLFGDDSKEPLIVKCDFLVSKFALKFYFYRRYAPVLELVGDEERSVRLAAYQCVVGSKWSWPIALETAWFQPLNL